MADITLSSATYVRPYTANHGTPRIRYYQESTYASTAPIAYGNVVTFDEAEATAAHRVVRGSTAAGRLLSTGIVGIAAEASTGVPNPPGSSRVLGVYVADGQTEFLFPFKGTVASSHVGALIDLNWDSTDNYHYLDATSTAASARVYVTEIPNEATVNGDTNGFYVGQFVSTAVAPSVRIR